MSPPTLSSSKKPRRKATLVHRPKRVVSSHEHSYFKTALSQSRINNINYKKRNKKLLENNKSLAQALEAAEISRQQQEQIILHLQQQLTLTNPVVVKTNIQKMGMLIQQVVDLMADTLELVGSVGDDDDFTVPIELPPQPLDVASGSSDSRSVPECTPVGVSDVGPRRRSLHNDLREKFGICDLTVINEDTLRIQETNLPPILFTDGEDHNNSRNSRRNSSRQKSSRKGRSTMVSQLEGSTNVDPNELASGDNVKFGESPSPGEQKLLIDSPFMFNSRDHMPNSSSVKKDRSSLAVQHDELPSLGRNFPTPRTPSISPVGKFHRIHAENSNIPSTTSVISPIQSKAKHVKKSNIPKPIKGMPKKDAAVEFSNSDLSADALHRRGTFVLSNTVSSDDVDELQQEQYNKQTLTTEITSSDQDTPSGSADQNVIYGGKLRSAGNEVLPSLVALQSEVTLSHTTHAVSPLRSTAKHVLVTSKANPKMEHVLPFTENVTVNLDEDMELTCALGKILAAPVNFSEAPIEKTEKLINPSLVNGIQVPFDETSNMTEIYCVESYCDATSQPSWSGSQLKGQDNKIPANVGSSVTSLIASQSANINLPKVPEDESLNQETVLNRGLSPREHNMNVNNGENTLPGTTILDTSALKTSCTNLELRVLVSKVNTSDIANAATQAEKKVASLPQPASLLPDFDTQLQPGNRRGTFVVTRTNEQPIASQPETSSSLGGMRKDRVIPDNASCCLSSSEPEGTLGSKSPRRSPRKKVNVPQLSEGNPGIFQPGKSLSEFRKMKSSRSQMLLKSCNKEGNACKEPNFKFFSKKSSVVSKNTSDKNTNKPPDKSNVDDEILKQKDVYDVSLSVSANSDTDNQVKEMPVKGNSNDEAADVPKQKCRSSVSWKRDQPSSMQHLATDVPSETKDIVPSKPLKRKSTAKENEKSKRAKYEKQNLRENELEESSFVRVLSGDKSGTPTSLSHDKEELSCQPNLRSHHKRRSVSFKMPSASDVHKFNSRESICNPLEVNQNVIQNKKSKESEGRTENTCKTPEVPEQTSKIISNTETLLVVLEDILSPAGNRNISKSGKHIGDVQLSKETTNAEDIVPPSNSVESADKDDPLIPAVSKCASVVDCRNEGSLINDKSVSEEPIIAELPKPSTNEKKVKKYSEAVMTHSQILNINKSKRSLSQKSKIAKTSKKVRKSNDKAGSAVVRKNKSSTAKGKLVLAEQIVTELPKHSAEEENMPPIQMVTARSVAELSKQSAEEEEDMPLFQIISRCNPSKESTQNGKIVKTSKQANQPNRKAGSAVGRKNKKSSTAKEKLVLEEQTLTKLQKPSAEEKGDMPLIQLMAARSVVDLPKHSTEEEEDIPLLQIMHRYHQSEESTPNGEISNTSKLANQPNHKVKATDIDGMDGFQTEISEPKKIGTSESNHCENASTKEPSTSSLQDAKKKLPPKRASKTKNKGDHGFDFVKMATSVAQTSISIGKAADVGVGVESDVQENICETNGKNKGPRTSSLKDANKKRTSKRVSRTQHKDIEIPNESKNGNAPNPLHSEIVGMQQETVEHQDTTRESSGRARRKASVVSYKELPLGTKLRRGDAFFI